MSATIAQKSAATSTHFFDCSSEIFQTAINEQHQANLGLEAANRDGHSLATLLEQQAELEKDQQQLSVGSSSAYRLHGALTRTISQPAQRQPQSPPQPPQQQQQQQQVASLVTIIENLSSMNLHRKLERTQSEPLPPQQPMNTSRYKTELCRPYEEAGECKYGEKCQFAHGYHELRNLQRHPKYKTEYCRTFHSVGFCPYGPRCHFVHNADEARALQAAQQAKQQQQQQQQQLKQQQSNNNNNNNNNNSQYFLPLSPPLSMSTGSDRESPTGSLSLSPTNSLTNFPFSDAAIAAQQQQQQQQQQQPKAAAFGFSLPIGQSPPESPNAPISPVHTPPPYSRSQPLEFPLIAAERESSAKQLLQKSASSPLQVQVQGGGEEEALRLPLFNRLSSVVDVMDIAYQQQQQSNLGL